MEQKFILFIFVHKIFVFLLYHYLEKFIFDVNITPEDDIPLGIMPMA